MKNVIIDVREKEEFSSEKIPHSINIPLSELQTLAPGILKNLEGCNFVLMCRSGKRAGLARQELEKLGLKYSYEVYPGGILEWKKTQPTECSGPAVFPIMRQVQLVAGLLVVLSTVASWCFDIKWSGVALFVGAGLTVAGATGFCGMATLLSFMPWNKCKET